MTFARAEYPRPHFDRSHSWLSLNGDWEFRRDPAAELEPEDLRTGTAHAETIAVPFAWETEASGIGAHWMSRGWYARDLEVPAEWTGQRVVLHFGAVHHAATVWIDGAQVGSHAGGYTPFEFDITDALGTSPAPRLVVRVDAPLDKRAIVHGKQRSIPRDDYDNCAFTPSSGIWQPVWLEARPATHIASVRLAPADGLDGIAVRVAIAGPNADSAITRVELHGQETLELSGSHGEGTVSIGDPRRWSPADPYLYDVRVTMSSPDGTDVVETYTGLRRVDVDGDRILLNGEPLYVRGVLDQGYRPRSGITAPTDDAFVIDLQLAKESGFNLVRKHLKLEDPRFFYHADRMGILVWAEPASTGRFSPEGAERFAAQIAPMVERDANHPSIAIWGLYNEEWGLDWDVAGDAAKQRVLRDAFTTLKALDPTRPAVDNSGWSHVETDLVDWHIYDETPAGWRAKLDRLFVDHAPTFPVGIGPGVVVDKVLQVAGDGVVRPNLNSEFGGGFTSVERGWNLRWQTLQLRRYGSITGYVWTELYDVEHEMAGIFDAERELKDSGGSIAADSNAPVVLIPDLLPSAPGDDLRASAAGDVEFDLQVSSTDGPVDGTRVWAWGAPLGGPDDHALLAKTGLEGAAASAPSFGLGNPVTVRDRLPDGRPVARLHVALVRDGAIAARVALDVVAHG